MRGRAFSRFKAAGALTVAVSAIAAPGALANDGPHIKLVSHTSARARTITFSGATTAEFPNLRAYWEPVLLAGTPCAATLAGRPRHAQELGWSDIVPQHAAGLASFERKETLPVGDTGAIHILCAYLVNHSGHVGAHARGSYRDPALR